MRINQKRKIKLKPTLLIVVILLISASLCYYLYVHVKNIYPSAISGQHNKATKSSGTTVPTNVENYVKNGGGSQDNSTTQGSGVVDTGGKNISRQTAGISSSSGNITLYSPLENQSITSQVSVSGVANVSEVFYRINDTTNGMIGSGRLAVHDGYFSGNLTVSTSASSGTFEVYSFNSQGQEINNISVNVKY